MRFQICRASLGSVSPEPPCRGAIRGPEAGAWPGEYSWYLDLATLEDLVAFLNANGGGLGLFVPEEGEAYPVLEVFDEDEDEDEE